MTRATGFALSAVAAAGLLGGCASAHRASLNDRLIRPAHAGTRLPAPFDAGVRSDSLETAIGKIREVSARARPVPKQVMGVTLETFDRSLAAALLVAATVPGGESQRNVADQYARLGIFDAAYRHYRAALAFNPTYAAAYDGLARLWRDARLPALALGDARRAVYFAPSSPEARNTLGTVLQALGENRAAEQAYQTALGLNPAAAYALNNLGYLALIEGNAPLAISYLQTALATDTMLTTARHNLALAYAASDRMDLARQALLDAGPVARANYNLGIINLSVGRRSEAMAAFDAACATVPKELAACDRAASLRSHMTSTQGGTP